MKKVIFILLFLLSFLLLGGALSTILGSKEWIVILFLLSIILLIFVIFFSNKFLLRMLGANLIDERIAPELCEIVGQISGTLKKELPHIAIMPNASSNALLLSSRDSYIVFTDEVLSSFSEDEIEATIVRMLSSKHATLKTWVGTVGFVVGYAGFTGSKWYGSRMPKKILGVLLLPLLFVASLLEGLFFTQKMVFEEDREGAHQLGKPDTLAKVVRLCEGASKMKIPKKGNASLSFLFLVNPYHGHFSSLFDFHPPVEKRISKLNEVSKRLGREIV